MSVGGSRLLWRCLAVIGVAIGTVVTAHGAPRVSAASAARQDPARREAARLQIPTYHIMRTPDPITVDGKLDEAVWGRVKPVGAFLRHNATPATCRTEAKLCWDDQYLYVAFACEDRDIWGTYTQRDDPIYDQEVVEIFIDPTGGLVDYFELEVSPRNVIWDGRIHNPGGMLGSPDFVGDKAWDCPGLLTAVQVVGTLDNRDDSDERWTVEMAIPFAGLARPTPVDGERWRGNLYRIDRGHEDEYLCWSPTLREPAAFHVPARFGWLAFSMRAA